MGRFSKLETQSRVEDSLAQRAATEASRGAQDEDPTCDAPGFLARGDESFFAGDTKDAMRWYGRAMQLDQSCLDAWVSHIRVLTLTGKLSEAKVWIIRGLSLFPEAPVLISLRAVNHARSGMIRQAMGASDMVLSKSAEDVACWLARGHILVISGNRNADFCFKQCMQLSAETDWRTPFLIGIILDSERQWWKSIPHYKDALDRRSALPYAWYRIARSYAHMGRREAAKKALLRAEQLCGDNDRLLSMVQNAGTGSWLGRLKYLFRRK